MNTNVTVNITSGTIVRGILFALLVVLLYYLRHIVLVVLTAVVLASAMEPAIFWFGRYRVPRVLSVIFIYLVFFISLGSVLYFFVPLVLSDTSDFLSALPHYTEALNATNVSKDIPLPSPAVQSLTSAFSLKDLVDQVQNTIANFSDGLWQTVRIVFGSVLSFVLIVVLTFYFAVQQGGIESFLRIITPIPQQDYVLDLWERSKRKIGLWMQGQLLLVVIVAVLTYLGLTIFGVKYALLLSIVAGVLELIPLFGIVLALVPAVGVAFADGGVTLALIVLGLYLIIQQFENHLIYPLVVKKVVGVPALLVILSLIVGTELVGFLGVILSVPAAATIQEWVSDLQKRRFAQNHGHA